MDAAEETAQVHLAPANAEIHGWRGGVTVPLVGYLQCVYTPYTRRDYPAKSYRPCTDQTLSRRGTATFKTRLSSNPTAIACCREIAMFETRPTADGAPLSAE